MTILFVNGVSNTRQSAQETANRLSKSVSSQVELFYNPITFTGNFGNEVKELAQRIEELMDSFWGVCIIAHSHGAKLTLNALREIRNRNIDLTKKNITIFTFGGAVDIGNEYGKKVGNVRNDGDFVQLVGKLVFDWESSRSKNVSFHPAGAHEFDSAYKKYASEEIKEFKRNEDCCHCMVGCICLVASVVYFFFTSYSIGNV